MKRGFILLVAILLSLNAECQQVQWQFKGRDAFVASPVIDKGVVYIGSTDSTMYAVDIASGSLKWKFKTGGQIRSTVCLNDESLFFMSSDGFYCLDKTDGHLRKMFHTHEVQADAYDYFQSSPSIYNGHLYVGSSDSNIYCFDIVSLSPVWKFKTNGLMHAKFAFGKGKVFAGSFDGNVYALNTDNGQLAWKFKSLGHDYFPKGEMQFPPTYANGMVYIGGRDYNMYAIDAEKGFVHWTRAYPEGWVTSISLSPRTDSVLLVSTSDPLVLVCMDGIYGADIWVAKVKSEVFGNSVFSGNTIYIGSANGKLNCFDRKTGKTGWIFATESYTANRSQYLKEDDAFRDDIGGILKTGDDYITMSKKLGGIFCTPVVTDDFVIIASMNGTIYCLKKNI